MVVLKKSFAQSMQRFARDFVAYGGSLSVVAAVLVALGSLLDGLGVVMLVPIITIVLGSGAHSGLLQTLASWIFTLTGAQTRFAKLSAMLSVFVLLLVLRGLATYWRDVVLMQLQTGFVEAKRIGVTTCLARARWDVVARLRHARITNLMGADIATMGSTANALVQCVVALTMLAFQAALAFFLSPVIAAIGMLLMIAGGVGSLLILSPAGKLGRFTADANLRLMDSSMQFLGGVKLAVSQNLQERFIREYHDALRTISEKRMSFTRQSARNRTLAVALTGAAGGAVVLVGFGVMNLAPSVLLPLLYLMARMNGPALIIQQCLQQLATTLPAYENIRELEEELKQDQGERADVHPIAVPSGAIRFDDVVFDHRDNAGRSHSLFRGIDLVIDEGSLVGLCGPSGAGKTTFADLLTGLYPPREGRISCGGVSLDGATLDSWRSGLAYVSQDPFLFHGTIRRNLEWMAPHAGEAEMWEALALAGADALVRRLPGGLETLVGERGTLISGGERQRLAIARALLRKPRLLVLDEATNAIDIAGEAQLLLRLRALRPRPTILIIAHRQESLAHCDQVLTLEHGRIAEYMRAAQ